MLRQLETCLLQRRRAGKIASAVWLFLLTPLVGPEVNALQTPLPAPTASDGESSKVTKQPYDSEQGFEQPPMDPEEAAAQFGLPDGFEMNLFAAEPDVRQPIAMATDARGRLWVAENYTYAERELNFDESLRDRILILEDTNGDGRADSRKVFWDQAHKLTSIALGQGGVWALCAPQLLFLPDRDGDDRFDGEPIVILDGWDENSVRHNVVNGLRWGPDGWLYGRHGILASSLVGRPGAPRESRVPLNCGIWRYHPKTDRFEVVATGTTNPWGMDWTQDGELFFINTVIGHLWHAVPGSHFERMYGGDFNPNWYTLMPQIADHVHWNTEEAWSDIRKEFTAETDAAGGGHAHVGLLIYEEDQWPDEYRGDIFTLNLHGRRINRERLEAAGSSYVARHEPDFAFAADPWFRGIDLVTGPAGQVWIADWSDTGECHENDGVHRSSGRIFTLSYPDRGRKPTRVDLTKSTLTELVELALSGSEWYVRQARRQLVERCTGQVSETQRQKVLAELRSRSENAPESLVRLRSLWTLYQLDAVSSQSLLTQLSSESPVLRRWAVRLLADQTISDPAVVEAFELLAAREQEGLVVTYLASALQRIPPHQRWSLARILATSKLARENPRLPMLIWYGIEPSVAAEPENAGGWLGADLPLSLVEWTVRRLALLQSENPEALTSAMQVTRGKLSGERQVAFLRGLSQGFQGARQIKTPVHWDVWKATLVNAEAADTRLVLAELDSLFGEGRGDEALLAIAQDGNADLAIRKQALLSLGGARSDKGRELLLKLISDRDLSGAALTALRNYEDEHVFEAVVNVFPRLRPDDVPKAITTLTARPASARRLLKAIGEERIASDWIGAYEWRQLLSLNQADLTREVYKLWPESQTWDDLEGQLQRVERLLTEENLAQADLQHGATLFRKNCANCHRLLGEGALIGPDLTGGQRGNLRYLLQNIITPSEEVATNYRTSLFEMADGQVIVGVVLNQLPDRLTVQTKEGVVTLSRSEIEDRQESSQSLMPNGLLNGLSDEEIVALFSFLKNAG